MRGQPQLLQRAAGRRRRVGDVGQRRAAPQGQRLAQQRAARAGSPSRSARRPSPASRSNRCASTSSAGDVQPVAAGAGLHGAGARRGSCAAGRPGTARRSPGRSGAASPATGRRRARSTATSGRARRRAGSAGRAAGRRRRRRAARRRRPSTVPESPPACAPLCHPPARRVAQVGASGSGAGGSVDADAVDAQRLGDRLEVGRRRRSCSCRCRRRSGRCAMVPAKSEPPLSPGSAQTLVRIRPVTRALARS